MSKFPYENILMQKVPAKLNFKYILYTEYIHLLARFLQKAYILSPLEKRRRNC